MSLVSIIKKSTDYNPSQYELDTKVLRTIEKGDSPYKMLWYNFCNPEDPQITEPSQLCNGVAKELYNAYKRKDKILGITEEGLRVIKYLAVGGGAMMIFGYKKVKWGILAIVIAVVAGRMKRGVYDRRVSLYNYWENLPEEKVLESIIRINENVGEIIFEELEKLRLGKA